MLRDFLILFDVFILGLVIGFSQESAIHLVIDMIT